jgi:mannosylglucosylglycerate synthase
LLGPSSPNGGHWETVRGTHYRRIVPTGTATIVSFRLGGSDGVSIEAAKWSRALGVLGYAVTTVAGEGRVDHLLPGLAIDATQAPSLAEVETALASADVVVVENLCSLPLNPAAAAVVTAALRGRPAVLHHHDLPWQRDRFAGAPPPPDDTAWRHVTINDLSRRQLATHGIAATVILNTFDVDVSLGHRDPARDAFGIDPEARVVLQPTRALSRKNVGAAVALSERLDATYWLLGPAEDGYGPELERILGAATVPVRRGWGRSARTSGPTVSRSGIGVPADDMASAYAACDVVALPSTWEGFGNPAIESAIHRRILAIGPYPVAAELAAFGFRWFAPDDAEAIANWLERPDPSLLDHNQAIARRHFSSEDLPARLAAVLDDLSAGEGPAR